MLLTTFIFLMKVMSKLSYYSLLTIVLRAFVNMTKKKKFLKLLDLIRIGEDKLEKEELREWKRALSLSLWATNI